MTLLTWDFLMEKGVFDKLSRALSCIPDRVFSLGKWVIGLAIVGFMVGFIIYDIFFSSDELKADNLMGLAGLTFYTLFCVCCSVAPHRINWRPVIWGNLIQLALGMIVRYHNFFYCVLCEKNETQDVAN